MASLAIWRNLLPYIFRGGLQPGSPSRRAASADYCTNKLLRRPEKVGGPCTSIRTLQ